MRQSRKRQGGVGLSSVAGSEAGRGSGSGSGPAGRLWRKLHVATSLVDGKVGARQVPSGDICSLLHCRPR